MSHSRFRPMRLDHCGLGRGHRQLNDIGADSIAAVKQDGCLRAGSERLVITRYRHVLAGSCTWAICCLLIPASELPMRPEPCTAVVSHEVLPVGSTSGHGRPRVSVDRRDISGLGPAVGAQAPVGHLGLVYHEAVFVARFQTRSLPHCAVDIMDCPTPAADQMVVVVTDPVLVPDGRACWFDMPQ